MTVAMISRPRIRFEPGESPLDARNSIRLRIAGLRLFSRSPPIRASCSIAEQYFFRFAERSPHDNFRLSPRDSQFADAVRFDTEDAGLPGPSREWTPLFFCPPRNVFTSGFSCSTLLTVSRALLGACALTPRLRGSLYPFLSRHPGQSSNSHLCGML